MPTQKFLSKSEADNPAIAREILEACKNQRVFAFYGDLGAGKTTLIKSLCEALGVQEEVTSPTFNLISEYEGEQYLVYHFDFYRIKNEEEAFALGVEEYFDSGEYCLIEWPERIPQLLPEEAVRIQLEIVDSQKRDITLTY
jgi:tRNA threonylcarbamoyladenosine biosynthesis protein TsaE